MQIVKTIAQISVILLYVVIMLFVSFGGAFGASPYTLKAGGDYTTLIDFLEDVDNSVLTEVDARVLNADITLLVSPEIFSETAATTTGTLNIDLAGYTFTIKPVSSTQGLHSTDHLTGARLNISYNAATAFITLALTDSVGGGTFIIDGLSFNVTSSTTAPAQLIYNAATWTTTASQVIIRNCVMKHTGAASPGEAILSWFDTAIYKYYNNTIIGFTNGIKNASVPNAASYVANNTIVNCTTAGIDLNSRAVLSCYNNIVTGTVTADADYKLVASATGYNNISEDTTAGNFAAGSGNQYSKTITFTDAANGEYFLPSSETDVINAGAFPVTGLINRWGFERTDGATGSVNITDYVDSKAFTSNGTLETLFNGKQGYSYVDFDGSAERLTIADGTLSTGFPGKGTGGSKDFTFSFFYRVTNASHAWSIVLAKFVNDTTTNQQYLLALNDSEVLIGYIYGWEAVTASAALTVGTWYHVNFAYDETGAGGTAYLRITNAETGAVLSSGSASIATTFVLDSDPPFAVNAFQDTVGGAYGSYGNYVEIDDLCVFNRTLTYAEMDRVRELQKDAFGRPRTGHANGTSTANTVPDCGAYEYIAPRSYYIATSGAADTYNGDSTYPWLTFANLDNRILNAGDTVYLTMDDTWADNLIINAVGANGSNVTLTRYDPGSGSANPEISGAVVGGNSIDLYSSNEVTISNITSDGAPDYGITSGGASGITMTSVTVNDSGTYGTDRTVPYPGYRILNSNDITMTNCDATWCNGHGAHFSNSETITISGGNYKYNGQIGKYYAGFGIYAGNSMTVSGATLSHNGYIGIDPGTSVIIEDCTIEYNGDGFSNQGVFFFEGTKTGSLTRGDTVTQETSGATGIVHTVQDVHHSTSLFSVWKTAGTFTAVGDGSDDIEKTNDVDYWRPTSVTNHGAHLDWSGGGIDINSNTENADGAIVRRNRVGYSYNTYLVNNDAYGIAIDDDTDGALVYDNIVYGNEGAGIDVYSNGAVSANAIYNNTLYQNCTSDDITSCGEIWVDTTVAAGSVHIGNNNVYASNGYAIRVDVAADVGTINYNYYYRPSGDIAYVVTTGYDSTELAGYRTVMSDEANSQFADCMMRDPANGDFRLKPNSPCVNAGDDLATEIGCTAGSTCLDINSNVIPYGGGSALWDVGAHESQMLGINTFMNNYRRRR